MSCADSTEEIPASAQEEEELRLTTQWVVQATRASSVGRTPDNQWTGNEEIIVTAGNRTRSYTVQADGSVKAGEEGPIYWTSNQALTVSAYYAPVDSLITSYKIETGQNQEYDAATGLTKFDRSDVLYSAPQTVKYGTTAVLEFRHLTAYVIVHVTTDSSTDITNMSAASIKIVNQHIESGTVNTDGSVAQRTTIGTKSITPLSTGNSADYKEAKALLVPQCTYGEPFITVTFNSGKSDQVKYSYVPSAANPINLEAGKKYTFNLLLTKMDLVLGNQGISDWNVTTETITSTPRK
jgi:hypothetical protein